MGDAFLDTYFGALSFLLGACIGSFLNVVIYRLPAGQSVVHPRSRCRCGAWIAWYDNIPILSWFILLGRCRTCRTPFSFRYPLVEFLTAMLFTACWIVGGWPIGAVWMVFVSLMIPAAMIDLDTMELPDTFTIGGFLAGVVLSTAVPESIHISATGPAFVGHLLALKASLLGAFVGSGLILWIALLGELIFRKEAMGFGDVKLMGAIGAFCGWQGAVFSLFAGALLGCIALLFIWPFWRMRGRTFSKQIPFGPSLAAGALLFILLAQPFVAAYFDEMSMAFSSLM
jgi:leader peptidase (prepilin peptidase)/N-methyltransferase